MAQKIKLKKADFSDIEFLWYLRNQPEVFKFFKNPRETQWQEHINWIMPVIFGKTNKELFVALFDKKPVGQIRLDWQENKNAEVSISLLKEFQGRGLGAKLLGQGIKSAKKKKAKALFAEIHPQNAASVRLFEKSGFKFQEEKDGFLIYLLQWQL